MTLKTYLRLLRPLPTLFFGVVYTFMGGPWAKLFLNVPVAYQWFAGLALVAPLLWGSILLGPLHEVMHQPFAMTLPRLTRTLRVWHAAATAVFAGVDVLVLHRCVRALPIAAAGGLVLAGLAVPMFNRRKRHWKNIRFWHLGTFAGAVLAIAYGTQAVYGAALASPWAVLLAGAALYGGGLMFGFRRCELRARANDPLFCFQSTLLNFGMMREAQRIMATRTRMPRGKEVRLAAVQFDGSVLSGVNVMNALRFPGGVTLRLVWLALFAPVTALAATHVMNWTVDHHMTFRATLANIAALTGGAVPTRAEGLGGIMYLVVPIVSFAVAVFLSQPQPGRFLPISRSRLANCHFAYTLIASVSLVAAIALGTTLVLVAADLATGVRPEVQVFAHVVALYVVAIPLLPLGYCVAMISSVWLRIMCAVVIGFGAILVAMLVVTTSTAHVLSTLSLIVCGAATLLTNGLYWWYVRRFYARGDLVCSSAALDMMAVSRI